MLIDLVSIFIYSLYIFYIIWQVALVAVILANEVEFRAIRFYFYIISSQSKLITIVQWLGDFGFILVIIPFI
jgi:hypothetical protein